MKLYRRYLSAVLAVVLLTLAGISQASATTARRNALTGNRLIEDREDVFLFPQLVVNYANLVGFDYAATGAPGNLAGDGMLLMGNERGAFGIAVHRGDLFSNALFPNTTGTTVLGGSQGPLNGSFQPAGTIVDVFGGLDLGAGLAGVRLALGNGSTSTTPDAGPATSNSQTLFLLQLGYSLSGPVVLDAALKFGYAGGSQEQGDDTPLSGSNILINLDARGYADIGQPFELGFLAGITFNSQSLDATAGGNTTTQSTNQFGIQGGAGPVWEVGDEDNDTTIAGYAVIGYAHSGTDPDTDTDDDATSNSAVFLPGIQIGADIELLDWLFFRSGARYAWTISGDSTEVAGGGSNDNSTHGAGFGWSAGLGVEVGDFRFDGTLANNFLLDGPNFIGGGAGFLTTASAQYQWE